MNDIWGNWFAAHKLNEIVRGKVSRMATFGAFVELAEGIEGLCHISEIEEKRRKQEDGQQRPGQKGAATPSLETGKEYDFKIVKLDPDQHRIGLSYRGALKQVEKREMEEYRSSKSSSTATIGDAISKRGDRSSQGYKFSEVLSFQGQLVICNQPREPRSRRLLADAQQSNGPHRV